MRKTLQTLALLLAAVPALAIDPGQAEGTLTINSSTVNLAYCYAVGNQPNALTGRQDDIKIVLVDKPLAADADFSQIEYAFPPESRGVVLLVSSSRQPVRVFIEHGTGIFESSDFKGGNFKVRLRSTREGDLDGRIESKPITASTLYLKFDANFRATVR
jgi:hypothetical protein